MNYIVLDLEFNQSINLPNGKNTPVNKACPFEIIQIGAVKIDGDFNFIDSKSFYIKPQIYTKMHPIVQRITGISLDTLSSKNFFDKVFEEFVDFCGKEKYIFGTWGSNDINLFYKNILFYNLNNKLLSRKFVDIQKLAQIKLNHPANLSIGLKNAVESLSLERELSYHDALNDAIYTSLIMQKVQPINMKTETVNISQIKLSTLAKVSDVNVNMLIKFAEKEFKRPLDDNDKEAIIKIYIEGQKRVYDAKKKKRKTT